MPIRWNSIDGYIKSLKAKKRLNIIQKRSKLRVPGITVEIIEDYAPYAERLTELWTNVAKQNNGYAHEQLTPSFFESMARHLKGRSRILAIKRQGKVITYGLNLLGNTEFFGMAEGLDYSFRDEYDLYANNIFEAIQQACRLNKKTFNIGITAYDFKTSIGAELDASIYFIKSFKNHCYTSVYANFIRKSIKQPDNFHRVFNDFDISNRIQLKEVEERLEIPSKNADPFSKHYNYTRANTARVTGLYTFFPVFESAQKPLVKNKNSEVIMLGTNAYLGLATHRKVKDAARKAIDKYGSGCSGSPALNGTLDLHQELSCELARFMQKEAALVFPSGYQTNVGAISALANRNDILVMDERNHASIVDGAVLSRATTVRYKHINVESLEAVLKRNYNKPKLVITDSLFSMEGTIVDLPRIVELCKQYKARLMLDESHAIGVLGPNGKGVAEQYGLSNEVDIVMGTFSKSLASAGGFVAGDHEIIDALKHISRGHIFSASLPPPAVAGTLAALKIIESEPERRVQLLNNSRFMANGLNNLGFEVSYHGGAILSVFCGHELIAITAYKRLLEEGVFVNPVVSPAVPKNREILRLSLMATHKMDDLQRALNIFEKIKTQFWPKKI
jgi:8-amino-7-oxononanoate synthase